MGALSTPLVGRERRLCALLYHLWEDHHMAGRFLIFYSQYYRRGRGVPRRVKYWHVLERLMVGYGR